MLTLNHIRIILCRPEGAINIGSVCRAMKAMGLTRLYIVNETPDIDRLWIKKMALQSHHIYEEAKHCSSLNEALEGTSLSAGVTRRRGKQRKMFSYLPEEFAKKTFVIEGEVALVFGNEQNGLNDAEVNCCNAAVHIPSHPDFPSLNLSHAVQVLTTALWRESQQEQIESYTPVKREKLEELIGTIHVTLKDLGIFHKSKPQEMDGFFRDIFARAALNEQEAQLMDKIFLTLRYIREKLTKN